MTRIYHKYEKVLTIGNILVMKNFLVIRKSKTTRIISAKKFIIKLTHLAL